MRPLAAAAVALLILPAAATASHNGAPTLDHYVQLGAGFLIANPRGARGGPGALPARAGGVRAVRRRRRAGQRAQGRRTVTVRRRLARGTTRVALTRAAARRLRPGTVRIRVTVDGREVAAGRAVLRPR